MKQYSDLSPSNTPEKLGRLSLIEDKEDQLRKAL